MLQLVAVVVEQEQLGLLILVMEVTEVHLQ
jgi:hypothetical protein